jgi:competence protein ComFC
MKVLSELIFPSLCIHCEIKTAGTLFCKGCSCFFELIDPQSRCPYCFAENDGRRPCQECVQKRRWQLKMASALDYLGAVSSLIKALKYGRMPYLAETGGHFLVMQFYRLGWPLPDLIIPVPRRNWFHGINHAHLLAQCIAKNLNVPCKPYIKRRAGDLSQARLTKEQREELSSSSFYLKNKAPVEDKTILLIDDVITTGTTLRRCAEAFAESYPAGLYALSLARSINF